MVDLELPDHGHQVGSSFEIGSDLIGNAPGPLRIHPFHQVQGFSDLCVITLSGTVQVLFDPVPQESFGLSRK